MMSISEEINELIEQLEKLAYRTADQERALKFGREFRDRGYTSNYSNQDTDVRQMLGSAIEGQRRAPLQPYRSPLHEVVFSSLERAQQWLVDNRSPHMWHSKPWYNDHLRCWTVSWCHR